jgi:hypothetical protein
MRRLPARREGSLTRLLVVAFMLLCQLPRPASAAESGGVVLLTVAAHQEQASELEAVAQELLERLGLQIELRRVQRVQLTELRKPATHGSPYVARVWIALARGRARLYLEHTARDRLLVREIKSEAHNPELLREELGHILQTALEGLIAGEEIGAPRGEALAEVEPETEPPTRSSGERPPRPPEPVGEANPPARRFRFGPRYEAVFLGDRGKLVDGPGAALGLALPAAPRFGLELAGTYRRPIRVERDQIGARLHSFGAALYLTFEPWQSARSTLRLALGGGADVVKVSPFSTTTTVELTPSAWRRLAIARAACAYTRQVSSFLHLELLAGFELDASGTRYVLSTPSGERDVLGPWAVRPFLSLGAMVP